MSKFLVLLLGCCLTLPVFSQSPRAANNQATSPYLKTWIQPLLRFNIDKDIDAVHFIRDNTDPNVVTKAFVLKHADAIELVPIVRNMAQAVKNNSDSVGAYAIKYNDGASILFISAEEDRFEARSDEHGIDDVIKALDQPGMKASTGSARFLYFPMFRSVDELKRLVYNVGTAHRNDPFELQQGKDIVVADPELNGLFFFTSQFSKKNISSMLNTYDRPLPQARIKFTVYETDAENDGEVGNDFQTWKNQAGADMFSIGGRFRDNWNIVPADGVAPQSGSNRTSFINLSPKWSTAYLDFIISSGKARVMTSGEITVCHDRPAVIDRTTKVFVTENTPLGNPVLSYFQTVDGVIFSSQNALADYYFTAADSHGRPITIASGSLTGSVSAVKMIPPGNADAVRYQLALEGGTWVKNGEELGRQTDAATFELFQREVDSSGNITWLPVEWIEDVTIGKGVTQKTVPSPGFGFIMTVTPKIFGKSSLLQLQVTNSSLVGWQSDGTPRINRDSDLSTEVTISNDGGRFVLGGIEKSTVVRSVGGAPFLRELPGLGWLFASESESTKKTSLLVVAECRLSPVDDTGAASDEQRRKKVEQNVKDAGGKINWGYGQYHNNK